MSSCKMIAHVTSLATTATPRLQRRSSRQGSCAEHGYGDRSHYDFKDEEVAAGETATMVLRALQSFSMSG